jgi:hypothetical protein
MHPSIAAGDEHIEFVPHEQLLSPYDRGVIAINGFPSSGIGYQLEEMDETSPFP